MLDREPKKANDLELLARLTRLAWLSVAQQERLVAAMTSYDAAPEELIFADDAAAISNVFILLSGAARFSCVGVKRGRIAIAILPPGVIPRPPALAHFNCQFRCEAIRHSRVAKISRDSFIEIALGIRAASFDRMANLVFGGLDNLLTRYPGFTGLDLRSRVALALLELGASFGAQNTRGDVLTITPTQQELADLVGASRPKISIILGEFVRRRAIYREGRRIAIVPSRLEEMAQLHRPVR
ncbi:MAG: Crp/Fnr family transcriptional regulator [Deltaproteobacteria bacterium]|nr:Crp/Fnr family transcriptional regulator [Deltaproteobacteria bacterium]